MGINQLLDEDVTILGLLGIILITYSFIPLSVASGSSIEERLVFSGLGLATVIVAGIIQIRRRGQRELQFLILRAVSENNGFPDGDGAVPSPVQSKLGIQTILFQTYVNDLIHRGYLVLTPRGRLMLTVDGMEIAADRKWRRFFEREETADS